MWLYIAKVSFFVKSFFPLWKLCFQEYNTLPVKKIKMVADNTIDRNQEAYSWAQPLNTCYIFSYKIALSRDCKPIP